MISAVKYFTLLINRKFVVAILLPLLLVAACTKDESKPSGGPTFPVNPEVPEIVTDVDGNRYNVVQIGEQFWISENLRATRFNNGDPIPTGLPEHEWNNTHISEKGAFIVYPHNEVDGIDSYDEMISAYGVLYNYYATVDDRGLCPTGWRVPTDRDWTDLESFLRSEGHAGEEAKVLKSCRQIGTPMGDNCNTTEHPRWEYHDSQFGTDLYGFAALPAGYYSLNGFGASSYPGYFWSATSQQPNTAYIRIITYDSPVIQRAAHDKRVGFSVRCVRYKNKLNDF
jgi:uncharacterized protein (TIGR02145 family)